jgi:hypothetical protein
MDDTQKYIAKLKISGVYVDIQYNEETGIILLKDVHSQDPNLKFVLDVKHINDGQVVLSNELPTRIMNRRVSSLVKSNIQLDISGIDFSIQSVELFEGILQTNVCGYEPRRFDRYGVILNFTLDKNAWDNFDQFVYEKFLKCNIESEYADHFAVGLEYISDLMDFNLSNFKNQVYEKLREFGCTSTAKMHVTESIYSELQETLDDFRYNLESEYNLDFSYGLDDESTLDWDDESDRDKLHKIGMQLVELVRHHDDMFEYDRVEESAKRFKSRNSEVSKEVPICIYFNKAFVLKAQALNREIRKLMRMEKA